MNSDQESFKGDFKGNKDSQLRELQQSELRFRSLIESIGDWLWEVDENDTYTYVSPSVRVLLGYEPEEVLGRTCFDLMPPDEAQRIAKIAGPILASHEPIVLLENTLLRKDGATVTVETSGEPIFDENGIFRGYRGIDRDITDRKHKELQLRRANRTLRVLSDVNQALIRAADESELLNQVCKIAVDVGGYRMAWVGYAEYDADKTVRPVAHAGHEDGYLSEIKISYANNEWGLGPAGTAIRTAKPCWMADVEITPSYAPWREAALKRGYRSSISFPLIAGDYIIGALSLYRDVAAVFDPEEECLLVELASDLAYGIETLRTREERRQAELALQTSENLMRQFVQHTPAAVAMFDRNICYVLYSDRWLIDYKLGDQNLIGRSHYEVFPDIPDRWKEIHQRALAGSIERCEEDEFVRADGTSEWIRWEVRPWWNETGEIGGIIMFTEVITAQKQSEQTLRESEEKYRNLVETTDTGYLIVDTKGRVVDANAEYARLTGHHNLEEIVGRSVIEWTAPYDLKRNKQAVKKCAETGKVRNLYIDYVSPEGKITPIEIDATVIETADGPRILTLCRDVTERRQADEKLAQEKKLTETIANAVPGVFSMFDRQGRVVWHNQYAKTNLKYEYDEQGYAIADSSIVEEDQPLAKKAIKAALSKRSPTAVIREKHKDGTIHHYYYTVSLIELDEDYFIIAAGVDITDSIRAQQDRRALEQQMEEQKRKFYRETIFSVTDGKLEICEEAEVKPYTDAAEMTFDLNKASDVGLARKQAKSFFGSHYLINDDLESFMLGVGEAATNAIKHGVQGSLSVGATDDEVWVAIKDTGTGIESLILPRAVLHLGFSTKPSLGLGYSIMLDVADRLLLNTGPQGTTVVLIKSLHEKTPNVLSLPDNWETIPDLAI